MIISQADMFGLFIFAAVMYCIGTAVVYFSVGALRENNRALQSKIEELSDKLDTSDRAKSQLQRSIDSILLRPDYLLNCLQTAQTDDEKKECIRNLMGLTK